MVELIIVLVLLAIGYGFGQLAERRHYKSIIKREAAFNRIPVIASRVPPDDGDGPPPRTQLVTGSVVISIDYFKQFVAGLYALVGGRVTSYESLIDRARREAILRMKDQARMKGGKMVFNVKIETASISKGAKDRIGSVEVLAYGTALIPERE